MTALRSQSALTTTVNRHLTADLLIGHVLPDGTQVTQVTLNGKTAKYDVRATARGREVVVQVPAGSGTTTLVVSYR